MAAEDMFGRAAERRELQRLVSGGIPVAVLGPAGIGKTTLVREALRGRSTRRGGALASLQWSPYLPLAQAVRAPLHGEPDEVAALVLARTGAAVLVVEDLHWADEGTTNALEVLARRLPIVVTVRTDESGAVTGPAERGLAGMGAARLQLSPLAARAARAVIARRHPDLAGPDVERLLASAGGNPLLLEQLPVLGVVSPTLRQALSTQLERAGEQARRDLLVLATAGHPLVRSLVAAALTDPVTRALIRNADDEVELGHASVSETLHALASPAEQRAAHRVLANHLDDPLLRARHLRAAGDDSAAGAVARDALADEKDAARRAHLLWVVADSGLDPTGRARRDAAEALLDVGAWDDAVTLATADDEGTGADERDAEVHAECHVIAGLAHWSAGRPADARRELDAVARLVPDTSPVAVRAQVEAANQAGRAHPGPEAIAEASAALERAEAAGAHRWRARAVLGQALMFSLRPGWDDVLRTVMVEAHDGGDEQAELSAAFALVSGLGFAGALPDAIEMSRAALARLADRPFGTWHAHFAGSLVMNGMLAGEDRDEVIALARRILAERPLFRNRAQVDTALVTALADEGRLDEAEAALREARRVARGDEDRSLLLVADAELGWVTADGARIRRAAADADDLEHEWFGVTAVARALTGYAALDDGGPVPDRTPASGLPALASAAIEHRALAAWAGGDTVDALAGLDAAVEGWDAVGLARFAARACWAAAEVAARAGHPTARSRARSARDRAATLALAPLLARANRTVASVSAAAPLTPREREVLELVAAGLTTPAIAARLGVGAATVDSHVRSACRKLGARTRWQAAMAVVAPRRHSGQGVGTNQG